MKIINHKKFMIANHFFAPFDISNMVGWFFDRRIAAGNSVIGAGRRNPSF
jgi:hypothetical protein